MADYPPFGASRSVVSGTDGTVGGAGGTPISPAVVSSTQPLVPTRTLSDAYQRPNGALGNDPASGYLWTSSGSGLPVILGNAMVNSVAGAAAGYGMVDLRTAPVELGGTFKFTTSGTDAPGGTVVIATANDGRTLLNLVHVVVSQAGWLVQKRVAGVFTTIASGNWQTGLVLGTVYSFRWLMVDPVAGTIRVYWPDGTNATFTDAALAAVHGRFVFFENFVVANGSTPQWLSTYAIEAVNVTNPATARLRQAWLPLDGIVANMGVHDRMQALAALTSGTLFLTPMAEPLPPGIPINSVTFLSVAAAVTPTNQWAVLTDQAGRVLAKSTDLTTTPWGAGILQTFTFTAPYTPAGPLAVFAGLCVVAATVPTLQGVVHDNIGFYNYGPQGGGGLSILGGNSNAGLTTPATCPAIVAAVGASISMPFAMLA